MGIITGSSWTHLRTDKNHTFKMLQIVNMTVIAKLAVLRSKVKYICHLEETVL